MRKFAFLMWFLGISFVVFMVVMFAVMNSTPAHVDLFFAEGDIATFLVIASSFLVGFSTCFILSWLRRVANRHVRPERRATHTSLRSMTDEF